MGAYSGVGAYLSSSGSEVGTYSGGGLIREWGLNRSFTVYLNCCLLYLNYCFCSCYHTMPSAICKLFSEFLIFCNLFEIIAKYEKRGKYLPIMQEATCDNYFTVKCFLKSNIATIYLLTNSFELA